MTDDVVLHKNDLSLDHDIKAWLPCPLCLSSRFAPIITPFSWFIEFAAVSRALGQSRSTLRPMLRITLPTPSSSTQLVTRMPWLLRTSQVR